MSECRCCSGLSVETPAVVANRQGLRAVAYRSGTHAQFLATLLARLSSARLPDGHSPLLALTTRDDDDYTIALLDGFACVCDVLTFYQERIANEQYVRTARELFSVVELARLIGYRRQPGVAASTDLAFSVEEAPGALGQALGVGTTAQVAPSPPLRTVVEVGTKVQSIPGPGEEAQTFETVERIVARPAWNALRPLLRQPQRIAPGMDSLFLRGTATNLKPGDPVLIASGSTNRALRRVVAVTTDDEAKTTRVDFVESPGELRTWHRPTDLPPANPDAFQAKRPLTAKLVARQILGRTWNEADLTAVIAAQGWDRHVLAATVTRQLSRELSAPGERVFALRQRAAVFGHNAPKYRSLPASLREGEWVKRVVKREGDEPRVFEVRELPAYPNSWEFRSLRADSEAKGYIYLDNVYASILPNSWAVLQKPGLDHAVTQVLRVKENIETTRSDYTLTAKVSRLTVQRVAPDHAALSQFYIRNTSVLAQSERLLPAGIAIPNPVRGHSIVLDGFHLGLKVGQKVIVTGESNDLEGTVISEARTLKEVTIEGGLTVLTFYRGLEHEYRRDTVQINANVAPATHGESVQEVLGSGSGSQPFQEYVLRQPPLTYVSAANENGAASTLEVRVNDLLWHERPTLFGHGPRERIYTTRMDGQGRTTVVFGDGRTGARLPSGAENVRAHYRKGSGTAGNLEAHRLTQLLTRPLGLKGATNPLPASGGSDHERLRAARRNAPLTVQTLGRVVSLQDYEDFARAFAGIGKALATWTWNGSARGVFLTVAGDDGAAVETGSVLKTNLVNALRRAGDPAVPLTVATYRPRFFRLAAKLRVDPGHRPADVVEDVTRRLRAAFSFETRDFGQPVSRSEVIAVMQHVSGVLAVDLDELHRARVKEGLRQVLLAHAPEPGAASGLGAELLTLDERPVRLTVIR